MKNLIRIRHKNERIIIRFIIKPNLPVRPIISNIGTYTYKTADYLNGLLSERIKNDKYVLKDSFVFINRLSKIKLKENEYLISFDVESLFTNVPIKETLCIIKERFFKNDYETLDQLNWKD